MKELIQAVLIFAVLWAAFMLIIAIACIISKIHEHIERKRDRMLPNYFRVYDKNGNRIK